MGKTTSPTPSLAALAGSRLRNLPPADLQTPDERRRDNETLLAKLQRMRPDLYERVSKVVVDSDEDWFPLLERRFGSGIALDVVEIALTEER